MAVLSTACLSAAIGASHAHHPLTRLPALFDQRAKGKHALTPSRMHARMHTHTQSLIVLTYET